MSATPPTLHMFCGKIAAGKSTLAAELVQSQDAILLCEDAWLHALFPDQMSTVADFVRCSAKLRKIMGPHVTALLNARVSVVLDFHANTVKSRAWMRSLLDQTDAAHRLHVLAPPNAVCLERLHLRNAQGDHPFAVTDAQFHEISSHFEPPSVQEGFTIIRYD